jgi:hypothetical protein
MLTWLQDLLLKVASPILTNQLEEESPPRLTTRAVLGLLSFLTLAAGGVWQGGTVAVATLFLLIVFFTGFLFLAILVSQYAGMVEGARSALQNPPTVGETQIEITHEGKQLWASEKIYFHPGKADNKAKTVTFDVKVHAAYPAPEERKRIVEHYRAAVRKGEISDKEAWARSHYGISRRTLYRYEQEFPPET